MAENLVWRLVCRYKVFFVVGFIIFGIQIFLAYKSLSLSNSASYEDATYLGQSSLTDIKAKSATGADSTGDDEDSNNPSLLGNKRQQSASSSFSSNNVDLNGDTLATATLISPQQLGFVPPCDIISKDAISALQRAKTKDCRQHIAGIACAIQSRKFYPKTLPSYCPSNHTANNLLGCFRDEKKFRLLSGYFVNFKTSNTVEKCIQLCLQSGYPYAGVQYSTECFCGYDAPPEASKLPDSTCNMKCSGDQQAICGGYFAMNIYETGIAKFTAQIAESGVKRNATDEDNIRIAFLLTLNGRALRQVHRLLKSLYHTRHVYYIHIDERQDYLYRNLLELEKKFTNIRLARKRFSTIWGGASLLTMLMQCMHDLLNSSYQWDFVINLSESDFPVKKLEKLEEFLWANRNRNFVKGHGRETQRFIQKQGLDKTFVECDTHMWRIGDRKLPTGIQIDGGSDWIGLSRPFVEYVIQNKDSDELLKGLMIIFRHTLLPAESFFHTVLRNSKFCGTYVDNNLHVTNWKRKLGCKCQYKHVVDWCGCSPNDFKPEDWTRLQNTESKMLFFARKFEPIINQAIILKLEEWLYGPYPTDALNLHSYWQSFYNIEDKPTKQDDLTLTIAESLVRRLSRQWNTKQGVILELNHYMHSDQYKGYLLRFKTTDAVKNKTYELESRIRPVQYAKFAKNSKFAKRLKNFEISSDYDQKEQVSRNYHKFLGPYTDLVLTFTFVGSASHSPKDTSHSYNLTLLWIDPMGRLQDFNELHIEDSQTDNINYSKAILKQPLCPGIWTVKLIGRSAIYAQTKFLVTPLAFYNHQPIQTERARLINAGDGLTLSEDFSLPEEWIQYLPGHEESLQLKNLALRNALRTGEQLNEWVDDLTGKFHHFRETCAVNEDATKLSTASLEMLPLCRDTSWSTLAPDPKSDVYKLANIKR
ncbi:xylosyltransferase oxt [Musca domestica]|uniref:protein xylosyltransferase n=1 Tax=Musca domestica TaxID=7370 RepID=A0A1I8MRA7_MUSDO|nr:xylosyltransferase oxt [Musca domestica]